MKSNTTQVMQILAASILATAMAATGYAQAAAQPQSAPAADELVKLPAFNVSEAPADPYNAAEAISAARTASAILDTPMTVDVVTPAMIEDLGPNTLFDVTSYFAGVSPGRGTGPGGIDDRQTFRGFESFSRTIDNFSGYLLPTGTAADNNFDPVFLEHAELIMGPDTILSPNGAPGGTVNIITKSPSFTPGTDLTVEVGNFNADKVTVDSTGPIGDGKHMAFRAIASYQDAQTYAPGSVITYAGSAQFTYKFSDTAKFTVKYFGTQQRYGGTACLEGTLSGEEIYTGDTVGGATLSNSPQPGFPYNGWDGDATWSFRTLRDNMGEAEFTTALGDHINMRLAGQIYYSNSNNVMAFPSTSIGETWNQQTGESIAVTPINPAALPILALDQHEISRQVQFQNDFAGNYKLPGVTLQPVFGWAYQRGYIPDDWSVGDPNMPTANAATYYSPPVPTPTQYTQFSQNSPENGWTAQLYAYLRASFLNDRLFVSGGASRTWAGVNDYNFSNYVDSTGINAGTPGPVTDATFSNTGNALVPSVTPRHDTYMAGVLGKVLPNVSVYYNYSTNASIAASTPLWQDGVQNEFGVKTSFFNNRISISADHFEITENNVASTNPLFNTGQSTIPLLYANLTNHGEEVNVVGGITKELSIVLSYTNMKLRDFVDRRRRNIPDNMANLLLDYRFGDGVLKGADAFVGVIHEGDVAGETVTGFTSLGVPELPGYYVPSYNVVNVGAGYKYGRYTYHVDVENALDSKFWWQAQARTSLSPYPGLTFMVTMTVHI